MVKKIILVLLVAFMLPACTTPQIKTVYVDKNIPIPYVPHPPSISRPILDIQTLTPKQKADNGEMIKSLVISLHQATNYACSLEIIVNEYKDLSNLSLGTLLMAPAKPGTLSTVWTEMVSSLSIGQPQPPLLSLPIGSCTP
jgi:hypothetical protein